jgi:hypothetical protein
MALTLQQEPKAHQPAYNPLNYLISSNNSSNADFRYRVEVTVAGTKRAEFFLQPRPDTEKLWFDAHRVVEVFIKDEPSLVFTPAAGIARALNYTTYKIDVTEFEGAASGAVYSGNNRFANAMALPWPEYIAEDFDDYPSKEFLTKRRVISLRNTDVYQLNFITNFANSTTPEVTKVRYQPAGGSVSDISNTFTDGTNTQNYYLCVLAGFNQLSITAPSFEVWLSDGSNNVLGDKIKFVRDGYCVKDTDVVVYYLNRLGGWDALNFFANPQFNTTVERVQYSRVLGREASSKYEYSSTEHQIVTASAKFQDTITLRHQWMSDEESRAMTELLTSPQCYMKRGSDIIPIVVDSSEYQQRYRRSDRLFAGEISVKLAYDNITQRA